MEVAELVLKYVEALAWPVTVGILAWCLRAHLREAFGRMTRIETPAGALEFEASARSLRDETERLLARERDDEPRPADVPALPRQTSLAGMLRETDYRAVVVEERDRLSRPARPSESGPGGTPDATPGEAPDRTPDRTPDETPLAALEPDVDRPVNRRIALDAGQRHAGGVPARTNTGWSWETKLAEASRLAEGVPAPAVAAAWHAVERLARDAARLLRLPADGLGPPELIASLRTHLPFPVASVLNELHGLREEAVAHGGSVSPSAAHDYIAACAYVGRHLDHLVRQESRADPADDVW
ncbi:hypothetical protein GCM10009801_63750 [Streptomyces albiaxialis]|uniref:DUF4145 domain-containing protein n=1 Tax=Streptomyces albiaxialis TaxID=329523 RepID=A0ABP5IB49_9ACTN